MRLIFALAAVAMSWTVPASASGGFWCTTDDPSVKFSIESGLTRGAGNPLFGFKGNLEIADQTMASDLRTSAFTQDHLMQHWLDDEILNLQLHRERAEEKPFGEIDLTIETKLVEEGSYAGTYELRLHDMTGDTTGEGKTLDLAGKTMCSAE